MSEKFFDRSSLEPLRNLPLSTACRREFLILVNKMTIYNADHQDNENSLLLASFDSNLRDIIMDEDLKIFKEFPTACLND